MFGNYPVDWTHEREWRTKIRRYHYLDWGLTPKEGVPLLLPPTGFDYRVPLPVIIVKTQEEALGMKEWLAELPEYAGSNGYIKHYYKNRQSLRVLALDSVSEKLAVGDWGRQSLDALPSEPPMKARPVIR